ncbi:GNAT family N-acetyltransferase [Catellatospora sp. NPDC049609]|uniref:GNAT family N-acetyltransferase n=1 Tax=Catellatospora sp. NPDC049609 TaxID=3155505 RepID=UPI0034274FFC
MIVEIDPTSADEALLLRMHDIRRAGHLLANPDDPIEDDATGVGMLRVPRFPGRQWCAVAGDPVVGWAALDLRPDNGAGFVRVHVDPGHRRRGIGRALFAAALDRARAADRTVLTAVYGDAAGAAFAAAHGARTGQSVIRSLLRLPVAADPAPVPGYRAVTWVGPTPDGLLESYAETRNAIRDAPIENGVEWPRWTPESVRAQEDVAARRSVEMRVTAIVDGGGAVVAYTQMVVPSAPSEGAGTDATTVLAAHRRRGLATWVKVESLHRLAADRPDVAWVNTANAAANTGMLAVNRALGFRPVGTWTSAVYDLA